jgi:hypothetical protein
MNYELQLSFSDQDVKAQVQLVLGFGKRTIEESFKLGEMLVFKKQEKGHGNWLPYLKEIGLGEDTASRMMKAFNEKDKLIEGMTISQLVRPLNNANGGISEPEPVPVPEPPDPFKDWSEEEKKLRLEWDNGKNTIIVHMDRHKNLVRYACDRQVYKRIDRGTDWGNPFIMDVDGTRDQVCDWYEIHFLPYKKIRTKIFTLKGKILGCHCYPNRCHGETLKNIADETN